MYAMSCNNINQQLQNMIINANDRCNTIFVKKQYVDPIALQQLQNQSKNLRNLFAIYNDNINLLCKNYKNCLGQIQTMPKIKLSREETQQTLQNLKKIYPKFENKLARDIINRNSIIRKSYEDFMSYYLQANELKPEPSMNAYKQRNTQNMYSESTKNIYEKSLVRPNHSSMSRKRPLSTKGSKTINVNILNQAYQSFINKGSTNHYKMRTISGLSQENHYETIQYRGYHTTTNPQQNQSLLSRPKKVFFHGQKRYEQNMESAKKYQQFLFDGSQIVIRQRKTKQTNSKQIISNNGFICNSPFSSASSSKNKIKTTSKFAQRKSIDDIQRMQIHNRILMVNSVLAIGLPQSQGYRPKSRCWQYYFN